MVVYVSVCAREQLGVELEDLCVELVQRRNRVIHPAGLREQLRRCLSVPVITAIKALSLLAQRSTLGIIFNFRTAPPGVRTSRELIANYKESSILTFA